MRKYFGILIAGVFVAFAVQSGILAQGNKPDVSAHQEQGQTRAQDAREDTRHHQDGAQERSADVRQEVEERKSAIQQKVEERRATIKQEVCERRQSQLNSVMPHLATSSNTLKSNFDTIYERVQGFYGSGQLTVENYDELKASVDAAQADAAAAVETVNSYEFELDCGNPNLGQQLDGFRQAVAEARAALKAYQEALVELISALRAEAAEQESDNGSNQEAANGGSDAAENNVNNQEGARNEQ